MAERPILFSGEMVRAILAGRKTQTRRVVKGAALDWLQPGVFTPGFVAHPENHLCPFGVPGDTLWVREKHWIVERDGQGVDVPFLVYDDEWDGGFVKAKTPLRPWTGPFEKYGPRPSIHMPRWASRITLRVTGIRVERLQEISEADAKAEGVRSFVEDGCFVYEDYVHGRGTWTMSARDSFITLWESLYSHDYWTANPWVWVVEFEKEAPHA